MKSFFNEIILGNSGRFQITDFFSFGLNIDLYNGCSEGEYVSYRLKCSGLSSWMVNSGQEALSRRAEDIWGIVQGVGTRPPSTCGRRHLHALGMMGWLLMSLTPEDWGLNPTNDLVMQLLHGALAGPPSRDSAAQLMFAAWGVERGPSKYRALESAGAPRLPPRFLRRTSRGQFSSTENQGFVLCFFFLFFFATN